MNSTLSVVVDCCFVDHTSCIPLSSSTSVMSPVMIFFRESLNSFSCSKVSFFVSSYSSSSSSSLKYTTKAKLTYTGVWTCTLWDTKFDVQSFSKWTLLPAFFQILQLLHHSVKLLFQILPQFSSF